MLSLLPSRFACFPFCQQIRRASTPSVSLTPPTGLRLTFLGTGSSSPTPHRALASLVVQHRAGAFLFDAGDGTLNQLSRSGLRDRGIKFHDIFISHCHGDHLWGLAALLWDQFRRHPNEPFPTVWGPEGVRDYLIEALKYNQMHVGLGRTVLPVQFPQQWLTDEFVRSFRRKKTNLPFHRFPASSAPKRLLDQRDAYWKVYAAPLKHSTACYGYVFEEPAQSFNRRLVTPGRKLVLTADNCAAVEIKRLAMDCDVLVHEATLRDDRDEVARERFHSTFAMATDLASAVQARQLILTHFGSDLASSAATSIFGAMASPESTKFSGTCHQAHDLAVFDIPAREPVPINQSTKPNSPASAAN